MSFGNTNQLGADGIDFDKQKWDPWAKNIGNVVQQNRAKANQILTAGKALEVIVNTQTNNINGLTQTVNGHTTAIQNLQGTVTNHGNRLDALDVSVQNLTQTVNGHTNSINNLTQTSNTHTDDIQGLTDTSNTHTNEIQGLTETSEAHTLSINTINTNAQALDQRTTAVEQQVNTNGQDIKTLNQNADALGDRLIKAENKAEAIVQDIQALDAKTRTKIITLDEQAKEIGGLACNNRERLEKISANLEFFSSEYKAENKKLSDKQDESQRKLGTLDKVVQGHSVAVAELKEKAEKTEKKFAELDEKNSNYDLNFVKQGHAIKESFGLLKDHENDITEHSAKLGRNDSQLKEHSLSINEQKILLSSSKELNGKYFQDFGDQKTKVEYQGTTLSKVERKQAEFKSEITHVKDKLSAQEKSLTTLDNFYHKISGELTALHLEIQNIVNDARRNLNVMVSEVSQESKEALAVINQAKQEVKDVENRVATLLDLFSQIAELQSETKALREEIESIKSKMPEEKTLIDLAKEVADQRLVINELLEVKISNELEIQALKMQHAQFENFKKVVLYAFHQLARGENPLPHIVNELGVSSIINDSEGESKKVDNLYSPSELVNKSAMVSILEKNQQSSLEDASSSEPLQTVESSTTDKGLLENS